jgi:hypothetical protein
MALGDQIGGNSTLNRQGTIGTSVGEFNPDYAGLLHYRLVTGPKLVGLQEAAKDAADHKPLRRPAWFWFSSIPCPMRDGDTVDTLSTRWEECLARAQSEGMESVFGAITR